MFESSLPSEGDRFQCDEGYSRLGCYDLLGEDSDTSALENELRQELSQHGREPTHAEIERKLQKRLFHSLELVKKHETILEERVAHAEELMRRAKDEVDKAHSHRVEIEAELRAHIIKRHLMQPRPGRLDFVDGDVFSFIGLLVVVINFLCMLHASRMPEAVASRMDNIFLLWYVLELSLKAAHHKQHLFIGPCTAVSWNWLDAVIVVSGIIDDWIGLDRHYAVGLRVLRLFRVLRIFKLVKAFITSDLKWLHDSKWFDRLVSFVVFTNAVVMAFQLDHPSEGWLWVDNLFLTIYLFETSLRLKQFGTYFFTSPYDWQWNWLDFVIVTSGMLDLWLLPAIDTFENQFMPKGNDVIQTDDVAKVTGCMQMIRLLRVLRLVRVVRSVPELYNMLMGVVEAFRAMQWVVVLMLLTLYGSAMIFTQLVGKGIIYDGDVPDSAIEYYGTVYESIFSLFELMNGDTAMIKPLESVWMGRLMIAGFMVVSNWAVLAILTAVVSDNMVSSSTRLSKEQRKNEEEQAAQRHEEELLELFEAHDPGKIGYVTKEAWTTMIEDGPTRLQLTEGLPLSKDDLLDLFECLAVEDEGDDDVIVSAQSVKYEDLIHTLKTNLQVADKRSISHVLLRMRAMQAVICNKLDFSFRRRANRTMTGTVSLAAVRHDPSRNAGEFKALSEMEARKSTVDMDDGTRRSKSSPDFKHLLPGHDPSGNAGEFKACKSTVGMDDDARRSQSSPDFMQLLPGLAEELHSRGDLASYIMQSPERSESRPDITEGRQRAEENVGNAGNAAATLQQEVAPKKESDNFSAETWEGGKRATESTSAFTTPRPFESLALQDPPDPLPQHGPSDVVVPKEEDRNEFESPAECDIPLAPAEDDIPLAKWMVGGRPARTSSLQLEEKVFPPAELSVLLGKVERAQSLDETARSLDETVRGSLAETASSSGGDLSSRAPQQFASACITANPDAETRGRKVVGGAVSNEMLARFYSSTTGPSNASPLSAASSLSSLPSSSRKTIQRSASAIALRSRSLSVSAAGGSSPNISPTISPTMPMIRTASLEQLGEGVQTIPATVRSAGGTPVVSPLMRVKLAPGQVVNVQRSASLG